MREKAGVLRSGGPMVAARGAWPAAPAATSYMWLPAPRDVDGAEACRLLSISIAVRTERPRPRRSERVRSRGGFLVARVRF